MKHTLIFAAAALALSACSPAPAPEAPAAAVAAPVKHGFGPEISAEDFAQHVQMLSSDEFGGRAPGTDGEQKTADYVVAQFKRIDTCAAEFEAPGPAAWKRRQLVPGSADGGDHGRRSRQHRHPHAQG